MLFISLTLIVAVECLFSLVRPGYESCSDMGLTCHKVPVTYCAEHQGTFSLCRIFFFYMYIFQCPVKNVRMIMPLCMKYWACLIHSIEKTSSNKCTLPATKCKIIPLKEVLMFFWDLTGIKILTTSIHDSVQMGFDQRCFAVKHGNGTGLSRQFARLWQHQFNGVSALHCSRRLQ